MVNFNNRNGRLRRNVHWATWKADKIKCSVLGKQPKQERMGLKNERVPRENRNILPRQSKPQKDVGVYTGRERTLGGLEEPETPALQSIPWMNQHRWPLST